MWEIAHTQEAWINVERRLTLKRWRKSMIEGLTLDDVAKWRKDEEDTRSESEVIRDGYAKYKDPGFDLVRETMLRMRDHMLCTNGGHEFYIDRSGWYSVPCKDLTTSEDRFALI